MKCVTKKSSAAISRVPDFDEATTLPPDATSATGSSALASAWAIDPATVPRFRVTKCPTYGRQRSPSAEHPAKAAWRTSAPTRVEPPTRETLSSERTWLMSTRSAGRARRMESSGTRLCPPASTFASSPCSASRPSTSSSEPGRAYSNGGGFTVCPPRPAPTPWVGSAAARRRPGRGHPRRRSRSRPARSSVALAEALGRRER